MSLVKTKMIEPSYPEIWRVFISGSSFAGKTYFAKKLIAANLFDVKRIYYFHPDIHESFPIDWCDDFDIEIVCQAGLPTLDDINQMPKHSVIVLDDLFTEVAKSELMSYLFRVLSSKKKLHCFVMTQRYYAEGARGLNIRNCSNYHVLMSNADARTNMRVAFSMGLEKDVRVAIKANDKKLHPYIVIDRTNLARVNGLQVYIDILDKYMKVIIDGSIKVLVPNKEFEENWELTSDGYAKPKPTVTKQISDDKNKLLKIKETQNGIREQFDTKIRSDNEEKISKKLMSNKTKLKRLERKMAREVRKRRRKRL